MSNVLRYLSALILLSCLIFWLTKPNTPQTQILDDHATKHSQTAQHKAIQMPYTDKALNDDKQSSKNLQPSTAALEKQMAIKCPPRKGVAEHNIEDLKYHPSQLIKSLGESEQPIDTVFYASYSDELSDIERVNTLYQYFEQHPNDPISYFQLLNYCHRAQSSDICNQALLDRVYEVDPSNGILWINIASLKLQSGDQQGAENALSEAANQSKFSTYTYESIELVTERLVAATGVKYTSALSSAMGYDAALPLEYGRAIEHCLKAPVESLSLLDTCYRLGQALSQHSQVELNAGLGDSLVSDYYEKTLDTESAQQSQQKITQKLNRAKTVENFHALQTVLHHEELARAWLSTAKEYGESAANNQVPTQLQQEQIALQTGTCLNVYH